MKAETLNQAWTKGELNGIFCDTTNVLADLDDDGVVWLAFLYGRQTGVRQSQTNVVLTLEAAIVLRDQLNAAIAGMLDADAETRVPPDCNCPRCGEYRQDNLVWQDDGRVHCTNCGMRYDPDAPRNADQPQ